MEQCEFNVVSIIYSIGAGSSALCTVNGREVADPTRSDTWVVISTASREDNRNAKPCDGAAKEVLWFK